MSTRARVFVLLALAALGGGHAAAGPQDTRVGEVRVVYARQGTVLRADAAPLAKVVDTLPARTHVTVEEVRLPWVRVRAAGAGGATVSGWLRAYEAVEPSSLAPNPPPVASGGMTTVSSRDVSAAGRQLTAETERRYQASRADLARGYALVDQMERETAALDPLESVEFLMEGEIGRRGRDTLLPPRVPARPMPQPPRGGSKGVEDVVGGALDRLGFGGKREREILKAAAGAVSGLYFDQMAKDFGPDQEYYLGRAVAAHALARHGVDPDARRRRYVKRIGDAIVRVADPARLGGTYGGYHFEVLDTDEVNGVSGPGGFVLVTRGAVLACRTEDEVAALLCHELAHVALKHGERVLRAGKEFGSVVSAAGRLVGGIADIGDERVQAQLLNVFTTAVTDMARSSMQHDYGAGGEQEADVWGTYLLVDVLYDWHALRDVLRALPAHGAHGGGTHAHPAQRAAALEPVVAPYGPFAPREGVKQARLARFREAVGAGASPPR
jgi:hypothetical protein